MFNHNRPFISRARRPPLKPPTAQAAQAAQTAHVAVTAQTGAQRSPSLKTADRNRRKKTPGEKETDSEIAGQHFGFNSMRIKCKFWV